MTCVGISGIIKGCRGRPACHRSEEIMPCDQADNCGLNRPIITGFQGCLYRLIPLCAKPGTGQQPRAAPVPAPVCCAAIVAPDRAARRPNALAGPAPAGSRRQIVPRLECRTFSYLFHQHTLAYAQLFTLCGHEILELHAEYPRTFRARRQFGPVSRQSLPGARQW